MSPTEERPAGASPRPTFSFLTTAYRAEDTLGRVIDAVLAQTRGDWELIVVDNGRSEAVADVVRPHLRDPRVRLVRQENSGPTGGVMAAAAVATGRFLSVLNSDDSVAPTFCERLGDVLQRDAGIAAVTCDAWLFTDPGMRIAPRSYLRDAGLRGRPDGSRPLRLAEIIDGPCPYYTGAVRRDVWLELGGLECANPIVDDLDFWLRMIGAGHDVRMISDRLGLFRMEAGSESRPTDAARVEVFEQQRERALAAAAAASGAAADQAALARVLRRLRYLRSLRRARLAFLDGDVPGARAHARDAFRSKPSLRSASVLLSLTTVPGLLARLHPVKQRVAARLRRTPVS